MARTVSDMIGELDYCATAIQTRDPAICRRAADFDHYMGSYLQLQVTEARLTDCRPLVEAFEAARDAYLRFVGVGICCDILRGAAVRLHRQYLAERAIDAGDLQHAARLYNAGDSGIDIVRRAAERAADAARSQGARYVCENHIVLGDSE